MGHYITGSDIVKPKNTDDIEDIAVDTVKKEARNYGFLKANISRNDKTQSWDGEIFVCGNE